MHHAQERVHRVPRSSRQQQHGKRQGKKHQGSRNSTGLPYPPPPPPGYLSTQGDAAGYHCPEEGILPPSTPSLPRQRRHGGKRMRKTGGRATPTSGEVHAPNSLSICPEGNVQARTLISTRRWWHRGQYGGRGKHRMVRVIDDWLPYLPLPTFPPPLLPACCDEMPLGPNVNHMIESGAQA